jgi:hypothetical protein
LPTVEQPKAEQPKAEVEKPKEQQPRTEAEKPKAEEKAKTEKPKEEGKSKTEKPKPGGGRVGLQQRQANRVFNQELEAQQLQHRPVVGYKYAHGDASLSFPPFCVSFVYGETVNADNRNESKR